jgi:hypothetical protein
MFRRRGYPPRPTVRAMTSMQGALSFVRLDCKQASILPPPGCTPPHNELTSPRHSLAIAAAPTSTAWHGRVRSARCELRQALIPPGATSPHAALISAAHSLAISPCCAIVYVVESNVMAPITKIIFCIGYPPDVLTNCMQGTQSVLGTLMWVGPRSFGQPTLRSQGPALVGVSIGGDAFALRQRPAARVSLRQLIFVD